MDFFMYQQKIVGNIHHLWFLMATNFCACKNWLPFELRVAPVYSQRYINAVFVDLIAKGIVVVYMDDLIIPSIDFIKECTKVSKSKVS